MNGLKCAAACHMMKIRRVKEDMPGAEPICERYDVHRHNPQNEFECSNNYTRCMASYALFYAFSAFQFNMTESSVGFEPFITQEVLFR